MIGSQSQLVLAFEIPKPRTKSGALPPRCLAFRTDRELRGKHHGPIPEVPGANGVETARPLCRFATEVFKLDVNISEEVIAQLISEITCLQMYNYNQ